MNEQAMLEGHEHPMLDPRDPLAVIRTARGGDQSRVRR
jgi:hypothetical protein